MQKYSKTLYTNALMTKEFGAEDGTIAGYASTTLLDSYDHVVAPNAFSASIAEKGLTGPKGVKLLLNHDMGKPAGVFTKLEQRPEGLWLEAKLNLNISYVKDAHEYLKSNGGSNFSVGFRMQDYEIKENPVTKDEYVLIKRGELKEISLVTIPANDDCVMTFVKSLEPDGELGLPPFDDQIISLDAPAITMAQFEKAIIAAGFAKSRLHANEIVKFVKLSSALFVAETPPVIVPASPLVAQKQLDTLAGIIERMKKTLAPSGS